MEESRGKVCQSVTQRLIGSFIGLNIRYSWVVLAVWVLATAGLGAGLNFLSTATNLNQAISPNDDIAYQANVAQDEAFPDIGKPCFVYIVSNDDNILTLAAYQELLSLDTSFRSLVNYDGYYFNDICLRVVPEAPCYIISHPLSYWTVAPNTYSLSGVTSDEQLLAQINSGKSISGAAVNSITMFGTPTPLEYENPSGSNSIQTAKGVFYTFLMTGTEDLDSTVKDYGGKLEDFFHSFNQNSTYISAYTINHKILDRDVPPMIVANIGIMLLVGLNIICGTFMLLFTRKGFRAPNIEIGIASIVLIAFSLAQGVGLAAYSAMADSLSAITVAPYLLVLMCLPHTYFLLQAFNEHIDLSPLDRVVITYKKVGPAMLATCVLHVLGFAFLSTLSVIRLLRVTSIMAVVFTAETVGLFTVMPIVMHYVAKRQAANLPDCFGASACLPWYKPVSVDDSNSTRKSSTESGVVKAILKWPVLIAVTALLTAFLVINIYYTSILDFRATIQWILKHNSMARNSFNIRDNYYNDQVGIQVIITCRNTNLAENAQQLAMMQLVEDIESCKGCTKQRYIAGTTASWYTYFQGWVSLGACHIGTNTVTLEPDGTVNELYFSTCLNEFLSTAGLQFLPNVGWNANNTEVIANWILTNIVYFKDEDVTHGLEETRSILSAGPGDCTMFNPELTILDQYIMIEIYEIAQLVPMSVSIFLFVSLFLGSFYKGLVTVTLSFTTVLAMFGIISYGDFTQPNTILGTSIGVAYAASVDYYIYLFGIHNVQVGDQRVHTSLNKFLGPVICKFLVMAAGIITLGACPNFWEIAPIAVIYAVVNLLNSLFVATLALKLDERFGSKQLKAVSTEGHLTDKKFSEKELEEFPDFLKKNSTEGQLVNQ